MRDYPDARFVVWHNGKAYGYKTQYGAYMKARDLSVKYPYKATVEEYGDYLVTYIKRQPQVLAD